MAWTPDDIDWHAFDPTCVDSGLLALVKAAALVEANADDYVAYLRGVFAGDAALLDRLERWGAEERQHGEVLGRWAMLADPGWDFALALARFQGGYRVPVDATASVRGSRAGELIARQVVETGTASFYSALRDAAAEPLLKAIAGRIAADEFAHYRLFARAVTNAAQLPLSQRLRIAATRFAETGDDELGWAWFAANVLPGDDGARYRRAVHNRSYARAALRLYRRAHVDNAVRMTLRAVQLSPNGRLYRLVSSALWGVLRARSALAT